VATWVREPRWIAPPDNLLKANIDGAIDRDTLTGATAVVFHDRVIRCNRIYNFLCSMLVLHQLLYVLFILRGIFMRFLELTY
jgi:hypothetical protein